jgi:DNA-directed RNA polymerase specialized sigma24 family protein
MSSFQIGQPLVPPHAPSSPPAMDLNSLPPHALSLDEIACRCREQTAHYLAGKPCDEAYALELFRRALTDQDQAAWQALYAQYASLVAAWVVRHAQFPASGEDVEFFVNAAFARFWRTAARQEIGLTCDRLGPILKYLKLCVHSVIQDECRRAQPWADNLGRKELLDTLADRSPGPEAQAMAHISVEALRRVILSRLQGEEERTVALLSWAYDLPPRQILAQRPDLFSTIEHIYRVKRNMVDRLGRDPHLQQLVRAVAAPTLPGRSS